MLLPLVMLVPLLGAGLVLMVRGSTRATRIISVTTMTTQLVVEVALLVQVDLGGTIVMHVGGWAAPVGIALVADRFAALMMVISGIVTLGVLIYAIAQQRPQTRPDVSASAFHPAMLVMSAGLANAFASGDLFNLFVSFEILLTASYVLLTLGGTPERMRAGAPYVVVSLLSSIIFLSAIALVYGATGTVNMADLAVKIGQLPASLTAVLQTLLLVTFSIKAAVWPMSAWLPDSYPSAPAPVTAVFAGLLTKVGIYAIVRVQTLVFGGRGFESVLMWAALATMIVGILGAIAQGDIKRMLSFTLVSHIGYMLFGVALGGAAALAATLYYIVHHILVQTALFLAAGIIEHLRGTTLVSRLGGLARAAPVLVLLFGVPAMNLAGIPPFSGFLGKVGLFVAGFDDGSALAVTVVVGGTATSLLTLYAIVRIWGRAFWRPTPPPEATDTGLAAARAEAGELDLSRPHDIAVTEPVEQTPEGVPTVAVATPLRTHIRPGRLPRGMVWSTAVIVACGVALTVVGGPFYAYTQRAATDIVSTEPYVDSVLGQP